MARLLIVSVACLLIGSMACLLIGSMACLLIGSMACLLIGSFACRLASLAIDPLGKCTRGGGTLFWSQQGRNKVENVPVHFEGGDLATPRTASALGAMGMCALEGPLGALEGL